MPLLSVQEVGWFSKSRINRFWPSKLRLLLKKVFFTNILGELVFLLIFLRRVVAHRVKECDCKGDRLWIWRK